jgi:hypothetical protein
MRPGSRAEPQGPGDRKGSLAPLEHKLHLSIELTQASSGTLHHLLHSCFHDSYHNTFQHRHRWIPQGSQLQVSSFGSRAAGPCDLASH